MKCLSKELLEFKFCLGYNGINTERKREIYMTVRGALKGLDRIKAKIDEKSFSGETPFIKLEDGQSCKLRFLQEFDEDGQGFDASRGTIVVVDEHVSPKSFRIRAVCSMEEDGTCWACDQVATIENQELAKKWRSRTRFYANVLVRDPEGEDKVKILAQGFGDANVGTWLVNFAAETGSLTGVDMKLSRKGKGMNDTSYSLIPLAAKPLTKDEQKLELVPLDKFIKYLPYDNQAAFYAGEVKEASVRDW